jgi:integrase
MRICISAGVTPDGLILMAQEKPDDVTEVVQTIGDGCYSKGSIGYANTIIHFAKTFFKVNKIDLALVSYSQPTRYRKRPEYIPTLLEALKMADMAKSLRDRLAILFLTYTGLRNSTLRAIVYDESYSDPLLQEYTIKKELERKEETLAIVVHEAMKKRVPNACKNRIFYYTFIPPKVTEDLRLHISELSQKLGSLTEGQPIFASEDQRLPKRLRLRKPIGIATLAIVVKDAAKRAGIKNWTHVYPHCLRKTCESFLRNQPDEIRLDEKEREFLFGHILPGSQDAYFDKTKIDEMRAKYQKMNFEPSLGSQKEEKVILEEELKKYLLDGWHFEAVLKSGSVVVFRKATTKAKPEKTE